MAIPATSRRTRPGGIIVWLAVSLVAIVGIVALGMDGGRMMEERRHVQAAADATALAAANAAVTMSSAGSPASSGAVAKPALQVAADNGYANDGISSTVSVKIGPTSGQFIGRQDCIEAIVVSTIPATFGRIFTSTDPTVVGRAVARFQPIRPGVSTMAPSGSDTVKITGSGKLKITNGSVVVNSSDPNAYTLTGNADSEALSHQVVGGYKTSGSATIVGPVNAGVAPTADALAGMPAPSLLGTLVQSGVNLNLNSNTTIQPGLYIGGLNVQANVTMAPGVYYIQGGGLSVTNGGNLTGNGVMIYNTGGGNVQFGNTNLTPASTGTYANVVFFQDRTAPAKITLNNNDNLQIAGTFYAPSAALTVQGGGTITGTGMGSVVSQSLTINGGSSVTLNIGGGAPAIPIRIVE